MVCETERSHYFPCGFTGTLHAGARKRLGPIRNASIAVWPSATSPSNTLHYRGGSGLRASYSTRSPKVHRRAALRAGCGEDRAAEQFDSGNVRVNNLSIGIPKLDRVLHAQSEIRLGGGYGGHNHTAEPRDMEGSLDLGKECHAATSGRKDCKDPAAFSSSHPNPK
jgi:hypothetical protein